MKCFLNLKNKKQGYGLVLFFIGAVFIGTVSLPVLWESKTKRFISSSHQLESIGNELENVGAAFTIHALEKGSYPTGIGSLRTSNAKTSAYLGPVTWTESENSFKLRVKYNEDSNNNPENEDPENEDPENNGSGNSNSGNDNSGNNNPENPNNPEDPENQEDPDDDTTEIIIDDIPDLSVNLVAGDLYLWGKNNHGQLGTGDKIDRLFPVKLTKCYAKDNITVVDLPAKVVDYSTGNGITVILLQNGEVYVWGASGPHLGPSWDGTHTEDILYPRYVDFNWKEFPSPVDDLPNQRSNDNPNGILYMFKTKPNGFVNGKVKSVHAGSSTTFTNIITHRIFAVVEGDNTEDTNKKYEVLFVWGQGTCGELGVPMSRKPNPSNRLITTVYSSYTKVPLGVIITSRNIPVETTTNIADLIEKNITSVAVGNKVGFISTPGKREIIGGVNYAGQLGLTNTMYTSYMNLSDNEFNARKAGRTAEANFWKNQMETWVSDSLEMGNRDVWGGDYNTYNSYLSGNWDITQHKANMINSPSINNIIPALPSTLYDTTNPSFPCTIAVNQMRTLNREQCLENAKRRFLVESVQTLDYQMLYTNQDPNKNLIWGDWGNWVLPDGFSNRTNPSNFCHTAVYYWGHPRNPFLSTFRSTPGSSSGIPYSGTPNLPHCTDISMYLAPTSGNPYIQVPFPASVARYSIVKEGFFILLDNGKIYLWGNNRWGFLLNTCSTSIVQTISFVMSEQQKENIDSTYSSIEKECLTNQRYVEVSTNNMDNFIDIATFYDNLITVRSNGEVWGIGNNNNGELGLGHKNPVHGQLVKIDALNGKDILKINNEHHGVAGVIVRSSY